MYYNINIFVGDVSGVEVLWARRIVFNMLHSRFYLSFFGSFMTLVLSMLFSILVHLIVGPIVLLKNVLLKNGEE